MRNKFYVNSGEIVLMIVNDNYRECKDIVLGDFKCGYYTSGKELMIGNGKDTYVAQFYGDVNEYIKDNTVMIQKYFFHRMDERLDTILRDFDRNFNKTISSLKELIYPSTKDLMLSKVVESFSKNIVSISDLFEDKNVKNKLFNLFKI